MTGQDILLRVRLSLPPPPQKKLVFICFDESALEIMKKKIVLSLKALYLGS